MLLSVHIPKTAGVSVRNILKEVYGRDFYLSYWQVTDAYGQIVPEVPASARCVHGHFVAHHLSDRFPRAQLMTWVRDPVERVVSSYQHRVREPDMQNWISRKVHEEKLSLLDFAAIPEARNEMTHFMGRKQPEDFFFIGVMEFFEESLARMCAKLNLPPQQIRHDNTNPERKTPYYEVPLDIREKLLALNEQDVAIYQESVALFRKRGRARSLVGKGAKMHALHLPV